MSGGVDSAVSALLLMEQGFDVTGVNLRVWEYDASCDPKKKSCCSPEDIQDARDTGLKLDIPFYVIRMEQVFKEKVMDRFVNDYSTGRTPNPCVECNTFVKFGSLFEKASKLGIQRIATGHYARIYKTENGRYAIRSGADSGKNQAYYLYGLSQDALANTIFPLGDMIKPQVREIAARYGLPVASKEESQEICFIPENDYRKFLEKRGVAFTPGYFRDTSGRILGKHSGRENFTIGQRKGLGISWSEPLYVISIEENGDVIVGPVHQTEAGPFQVEQVNFQAWTPEDFKEPVECRIQVRYRSKPVRAKITWVKYSDAVSYTGEKEGHILHVEPLDLLSAVTPGQSAVLFPKEGETPDDYLLAGGLISKSGIHT